MKKVKLKWFSANPVNSYFEGLRSENHFRNNIFQELNNFGFYMYLDTKSGEVRYVGQAFKDSPTALRNRIRWEIVKDGNSSAVSAFVEKCKKYDVDRFELKLKVAHIVNSFEEELNVAVDDKMMNAVERALIFDRAESGDRLMNETGKRSYKLGPIQIINLGEHTPLPEIIVLE